MPILTIIVISSTVLKTVVHIKVCDGIIMSLPTSVFFQKDFLLLIVWGTPKKRRIFYFFFGVVFFIYVFSDYMFFPFDYLYPQELECLQDHLDELLVDCREVVGNLTELESEVGENYNAAPMGHKVGTNALSP